jgi:hypothetical protein
VIAGDKKAEHAALAAIDPVVVRKSDHAGIGDVVDQHALVVPASVAQLIEDQRVVESVSVQPELIAVPCSLLEPEVLLVGAIEDRVQVSNLIDQERRRLVSLRFVAPPPAPGFVGVEIEIDPSRAAGRETDTADRAAKW